MPTKSLALLALPLLVLSAAAHAQHSTPPAPSSPPAPPAAEPAEPTAVPADDDEDRVITEPAPRPLMSGREGQPWSVLLSGDSRLTFRSDVRGSDADVLVSHTGAGVDLDGPLGENLRLGFGVAGEWGYYDFGNGSSIMPAGSDDFDDLFTLSTNLRVTYLIDESWGLTAFGFARAAGESDADVGDSITGGGALVASYAFSKDLRLGFGLGATSRLEDDAIVIPYLSIYWAINDRVRLTSKGLGLLLSADLDEAKRWEIGFRGAFEFRDYRLDDSRPGFRDGVVSDERVPLGVELAWKPVDGLRLTLEGGAVVYQRYEFISGAGDELDDFETDPAPFIGLRVEYRF